MAEIIMTDCDNCGCEIDVDDAWTCQKCGRTLCPECICESCENEET